MDFEVMPRGGVGILRFGMSIDEVRAAMALPVDPIPKSDSGIPTDAFLEHGVHVFYRQPGVCQAVEIYPPLRVLLHGVNLLREPYEKVKSFLKGLDAHLEEDNSGLTAKGLGIGIHAPWHTELPNAPTESVIVFEDGYYEFYES
jgi:hypothetical protein